MFGFALVMVTPHLWVRGDGEAVQREPMSAAPGFPGPTLAKVGVASPVDDGEQ